MLSRFSLVEMKQFRHKFATTPSVSFVHEKRPRKRPYLFKADSLCTAINYSCKWKGIFSCPIILPAPADWPASKHKQNVSVSVQALLEMLADHGRVVVIRLKSIARIKRDRFRVRWHNLYIKKIFKVGQHPFHQCIADMQLLVVRIH